MYGLTKLVNEPTCYKNVNNPSCIDLILTNRSKSFQNTTAIETGLSDFHKMTITIMKTVFKVTQPLQNDKNCQKYDFPDFCLILIFNQRTTFCEILGVKILAEML